MAYLKKLFAVLVYIKKVGGYVGINLKLLLMQYGIQFDCPSLRHFVIEELANRK